MVVRIILLAFCALGMSNAQVQAQIFLEQAKVSLNVSGGDHKNGSFLIHNTSSSPATVRVYWEDFKYKAPYNGTKDFLPAGTAPESASQWVTFSPQTFTMPGFGQQKFDYTVSVPNQIEQGHYGVLFFERSTAGNLNGDAVDLVTRLGCLFFIEPSNKSKKAVLQDFTISTKSLNANFINQGNVILIAHTTYYVMQDGGMVSLRGDAGKLYVPPGVSAPLTIALKKPLSAGHYTMVVNSDLDDGDVVVKEIGLSVDASGQLTILNTQD
jgi:P pilus assembly chaperone PapD